MEYASYTTLTSIISFIGSAFTTQFIFGFSLLQIIAITAISYLVLKVILGGG